VPAAPGVGLCPTSRPEAVDPLPPGLEGCRRCERLVAWRERVAREKRRAYANERYWGRPVPGFGDPEARLLLLGLAPGAHGSNRTGRMFTGDASGDFLYPALHRAGLASAPLSRSRDDGLALRGVWITAVVRCAPPGNKPSRSELDHCRPWLAHDVAGLPRLRAVLALGRVAHDGFLDLLRAAGHELTKARHPFGHGALHRLDRAPVLLDSYHVSFQNTNTGRLTPTMFDEVLEHAKALAGLARSP